jgi:hypothetical protein
MGCSFLAVLSRLSFLLSCPSRLSRQFFPAYLVRHVPFSPFSLAVLFCVSHSLLWIWLSFAGCSVQIVLSDFFLRISSLSVLFCLSCFDCPLKSALICLSRVDCPVAAVASRFACSACLSWTAGPFPFWLSRHGCLHAVPACLILMALSSRYCHDSSVLIVLSWQSYSTCPALPSAFCLSYSACPVSPVLCVQPVLF